LVRQRSWIFQSRLRSHYPYAFRRQRLNWLKVGYEILTWARILAKRRRWAVEHGTIKLPNFLLLLPFYFYIECNRVVLTAKYCEICEIVADISVLIA
jgi:hypothetical protein